MTEISMNVSNLTLWDAFKMRLAGFHNLKNSKKTGCYKKTQILKEVPNKPLLVVVTFKTFEGKLVRGIQKIAYRVADDIVHILVSGKLGYVAIPDWIKVSIISEKGDEE